MDFASKELLQRIRENGSSLRSAATELTNRVKVFEAWLGKLPGRVSASCILWTDDDKNIETRLTYTKHGKEWALLLIDYEVERDRVVEEVLLRDAPISAKVNAVPYFPRLVEDYAKRQVTVAALAVAVTQEFDEFAKQLKLGEGA